MDSQSAAIMDIASSLQCVWLFVHLLAVCTAFMLRIYSGTRAQPLLQALYLCGLAAVAAAALAGRHFCWQVGTLSSGVLALMIVAAVMELGSRHDAARAAGAA
jgi:hypothetical protein